MTYWGIDPDRYEGWTEVKKEEELKHVEIDPERELRDVTGDD
jgi:hypothetical protein